MKSNIAFANYSKIKREEKWYYGDEKAQKALFVSRNLKTSMTRKN